MIYANENPKPLDQRTDADSPMKNMYLSNSEMDTIQTNSAITFVGSQPLNSPRNGIYLNNLTSNTSASSTRLLPSNYPCDVSLKRSSDSSASLLASDGNSITNSTGIFAKPQSKKRPPPQAFTAIADLASYQSDSAITDHNLPFLFKCLNEHSGDMEPKYNINSRRQSAYSILVIARNTPCNFDKNLINLLFESLILNNDVCIQKSLIIALYSLSENKKCCQEMIDTNFSNIFDILINQKTDQIKFLAMAIIHNLLINQGQHFKPHFIAYQLHIKIINLLYSKSQKFLALVIDILNNLAVDSLEVKSSLMETRVDLQIMKLMHLNVYNPLLICACKFFSILANSSLYQSSLLDSGLPDIICRLLASSDIKVVEISLKILLIISSALSAKILHDCGYFTQKNRLLFFLAKCLKSTNIKIQKHSMLILSNLMARNDHIKAEVIRLHAHVSLIDGLELQVVSFTMLDATLSCLQNLFTIDHEETLVRNMLDYFLASNGFHHINSLICRNTNLVILLRILQLLKQILFQFARLKYDDKNITSFNLFPIFLLYINKAYSQLVPTSQHILQEPNILASQLKNIHQTNSYISHTNFEIQQKLQYKIGNPGEFDIPILTNNIINTITRLILEIILTLFNLTDCHLYLSKVHEEFCHQLILDVDIDSRNDTYSIAISQLAQTILSILLTNDSYNYTWCSIDLDQCKNLNDESINSLYGSIVDPNCHSTMIHDQGPSDTVKTNLLIDTLVEQQNIQLSDPENAIDLDFNNGSNG